MKTEVIQNKFENYAPWVLVLFHIIGIGLFLYPSRPEGLSGFNLLLCASLTFWSSYDWKQEGSLFLSLAFGGLLVECVGVHTGLLFGDYTYGNELGIKAYGVPIVLGLNWYCVVTTSAHVVQKWFSPNISLWIRALFVGLLCVGLDYLIEPVAIRYDFWDWEGGIIPLFNYVCWFVFSSLFAAWYLFKVKQINSTAYFLFFVWVLFFFILNLL